MCQGYFFFSQTELIDICVTAVVLVPSETSAPGHG